MNRKLIPCQVKDEYVIGAGVAVGAEGSGNDSALQLEFGEMWDGLVKYVTFRDALGENPVSVLLTTDMIQLVDRPILPPRRPEDPIFPPLCPPPPFHCDPTAPKEPTGLEGSAGTDSEGGSAEQRPCRPHKPPMEEVVVYLVPVPTQAKALEGRMKVTIQGYSLNEDGSQVETATMTATAYFKVLPSGWAMPEDESVTPTLAQQLQSQIEDIRTDIIDAAKAADALEQTQQAAAAAEESKTSAAGSAAQAAGSATAAAGSATGAAASATQAQAAAAKAQAAAETAAEDTAEALETEFEGLAAQAQASAQAAQTSAQAAKSSETAAQGSAEEAAGYAAQAKGQAEQAAGSAAAAGSSAVQAAESATAAANSAATAAGSEAAAEQAKTSAASSATAAEGSAQAAAGSASNAEYWAGQAAGIVGGDYPTRTEAQGYVSAHNEAQDAHPDIRAALAEKADLGTDGKVPESQLPEMDYVPTGEKGTPGGVAELGSDGKVPESQLPEMDYIPLAQKGAAEGVASLGTDGKVPEGQLPDPIPTVTTEGTGEAYTATVPGVTELKQGMLLTIIPHTNSTSTNATLDVNGLGAKGIRRYLSSHTLATTAPTTENWLRASKAVLLQYIGIYWVALGPTKPSVTDLSGTLTVDKGGTGRTSWPIRQLVYATELGQLGTVGAPDAASSILMQDPGGVPRWGTPEEIQGGMHSVGDILTTTRKGLGSSWLLCNGEQIDETQYPDLASAMGPVSELLVPTSIEPAYAICCDGLWFAFQEFVGDDGLPHYLTATDIAEAWTGHIIPSEYTWDSYRVYGVTCSGGVPTVLFSNSYNQYALVSRDQGATWSWNKISDTKHNPVGIYADGGMWVAIFDAYSGYGPYIYTATDPAGTWTLIRPSTSTNIELIDITAHNGTWAILTHDHSTSKALPFLYTSTNPASQWNTATLPIPETDSLAPLRIKWENGMWTILSLTTANPKYPVIYTAAAPTGPWTRHQINELPGIHFTDIIFNGSQYIACVKRGTNDNYTELATAESLDGPWKVQRVKTLSSANSGSTRIEKDGASWVMTGRLEKDLAVGGVYVLPELSADKSYVYIKALEGS